MANTRREVVGYQPFRTRPQLADGLLPVARPGGELLQKVSSAFFRVAEEAGAYADRQAQRAGALAGEQAALAGRPESQVTGGAGAAGGNERVRGARFAPEVNAAIARAAAEEGVDAGILSSFAQIESGGNPRAKNPTSSAAGLFQQIDSNAKQYGVADRLDAYQSAKGAAKFMRDNRAHLRKELGREPTAGELYLAHQQGPGGAAKLLRNPDALASSVVGAKAVSLNGGSPGMTAGQFANLWTRRVGGGYAIPTSPDALSGTAPSVSLTGGTWRPSGADTIYGRAYDEAGSKVYLQTLDTEIRSTTSQLFDKYKDDPAGLQKGLIELRGALGRDHVFPEIQADFEVGFDRLGEQYLEQARRNHIQKIEQRDRADFIERTGQLETDQRRQIADFDPSSPGAADAIASSQEAIDHHFDAAVERGIIDAADAASAKLTSRREAALGFYGKQASAQNADGVSAMRKNMEKDFADGGISGLDGQGWETLNKSLVALEEKKRTAERRAVKDFRSTGDRMAGLVERGKDVDPAELARYALDAGKTDAGKAALQETYAKIDLARSVRDLPLPEARAHVAGLKKQYGDQPTAAQARTVALGEKMLEAKRKAIVTDSVTYAERHGLAPETPLLSEAANPEEIAQTMESRVKAAADTAPRLGVQPRYLKKGEATALAKMVKADPANGAQLAGAIVAGAGVDAPAVLAEFGNEAPMIAAAGSIIVADGSSAAAEDAIAGMTTGANGKKLTGLKPETARKSLTDTVGSAMALQPKDRQLIGTAADAIARKRISDQGLDPASDEAIEVHDQAVQEAAGAVFDRGRQYGGFTDVGGGFFSSGSRVWVPSDIAADQFGEVLGSITDEDLAGLKVKPKAATEFRAVFGGPGGAGSTSARPSLTRALAGAVPVAVKGGYAFAMGDPSSDDPQFVQGEDGRVFVLDLLGLREKLQERVPGAWR